MTDGQRQRSPLGAGERRSLYRLVPLALGLAVCAGVYAQTGASACGDLANQFGPYDYRQHYGSSDYKGNQNNPLRLVEHGHFRPNNESLQNGNQGPKSEVGPEFEYVLRAFPNHHRALDALIRLAEKKKSDQPDMRFDVNCWFERAVRFRPDDIIVRMFYATYLGKRNRVPAALEQLDAAVRYSKEENFFTQYNLGLIYFDLKQFDKALVQAKKAYGQGMQRPELRDKLVSSGHWKAEVATSAASGPASAPESPR